MDNTDRTAMTAIEALQHQGTCAACGAEHRTALEAILIGSDAERQLAEALESRGHRHVLLVADVHTMDAAGTRVAAALSDRIDVVPLVYPDDHLVADEAAAQKLRDALGAMSPAADAIVAVGSGTLNDLSRVAATEAGLPYAIFATANSMDGYASSSSPMIRNRMKITVPGQVPMLIATDPAVLRDAPADMTAAGIGDTLGKHNVLSDWRLGELILDEACCPFIYGLVERSLTRLPDVIRGIRAGDTAAHAALFDALLTVGIAMAYHGSSRPASGAEHHLSHFWEMRLLLEGRPSIFHGVKVALGGRYINAYAHMLATWTPDEDEAVRHARAYTAEAREALIRQTYGVAADTVRDVAAAGGMLDPDARIARIRRIMACWPEIREVLSSVIDAKVYAELMADAGLPLLPSDRNLSRRDVTDALHAARYLRNRYTIMSLADDLGLTETLAAYAMETVGV